MLLALGVSCTRQDAPQLHGQIAVAAAAEAPAPALVAETPPAPVAPAVEKIAGNTTIKSFKRAKKLAPHVFVGHERTFYCGCAYDEAKKKDHVDPASCGYETRSTTKKGKARARRREWEHVVPAENFGRSFAAWREGHPECVDSKGRPFKGRQCAKKVEPVFRFMEADLYNLQPAIGEVNGRRSNYRPAMIPGEKREFGACDVEIADKQVEPRPEIRGDIARTYFYMAAAYPKHARLSRSGTFRKR